MSNQLFWTGKEWSSDPVKVRRYKSRGIAEAAADKMLQSSVFTSVSRRSISVEEVINFAIN